MLSVPWVKLSLADNRFNFFLNETIFLFSEWSIMLSIFRSILSPPQFQVHAFYFIPEKKQLRTDTLAIFTHGYTSHKGSLTNWAQRLVDKGIPTCLFDLPGHFQGSFLDIKNFADFEEQTHRLFLMALKEFHQYIPDLTSAKLPKLILGGHSLGALMSLKALELEELRQYDKMSFSVGLGFSYSENDKNHLFETDFFQKTLQIRQQLVSSHLSPTTVFPWIKEQKYKLPLKNQHIYLLTGEDDVVASPDKVSSLGKHLTDQSNQVHVEISSRLPHHAPELASSYLAKAIKFGLQQNI
jgi:predicted esterase